MKTKLNLMAGLMVGALAGGGLSSPANAALILAFSQLGTANTVTATAAQDGSGTEIVTNNTSIFITALDSPGFAGAAAFLTFDLTSSTQASGPGTSGNFRQNYNGKFSITSGTNGTGTNYLSGSFLDLFEAYSAGAVLTGSTPPASSVTFTSSVIPAADLGDDRAVSFGFTAVTPSILGLYTGTAGTTIPSFTAAVSGNFSADNTPVRVPEPISIGLLGIGLVGLGLARRKRT